MFSGSGLAWAVGLAGMLIGILLIRIGLLQQDEGAPDDDLLVRPWWYKVALGVAIGLAGASILAKAVTQP